MAWFKRKKAEEEIYVLDDQDDKRIRLRLPSGELMRSQTLSLSNRQITFVTQSRFMLKPGQTVKLDFWLPKADQLAWTAVIESVEPYISPTLRGEKLLRARASFIDFPKAAESKINRAIEESLLANNQKSASHWSFDFDFKIPVPKELPKILFWTVVLIAVSWGILLLFDKLNSGHDWVVEQTQQMQDRGGPPAQPFGQRAPPPSN